MNAARRKKLLVSAFVLSGAVFLLDRLFDPGPEEAAAMAAELISPGPAAPGAVASNTAGGANNNPLASRPMPSRVELSLLADRLLGKGETRLPVDALLPARDPFKTRLQREPEVATEDATLPTPSTTAAPTGEAASPSSAPALPPPEPFDTRHTLEGVIIGRVRMAWIDGKRVQVGSVVDGMRVVRIERDYVRLRRGNETATLRLLRRMP